MAMEETPRGPIVYNTKSGTTDFPDQYHMKMKRWREMARDEALRTLAMNPEYDNVHRYKDFLEGKQWNPGRPQYRSHFFDNKMAEARVETLALLTDIRPNIEVIARQPEFEDQASVIKLCWLSEWQRLCLELRLADVIDHALFSVGYWKIGGYTPGMLSVVSCGMDTVLPIQPGQHLQQAAAVLYRTFKPAQYFKMVYGEAAKDIERQAASRYTGGPNVYSRPPNIPQLTWNSLAPHMKQRMGVKISPETMAGQSPFPVVELEEYFIEDYSVNETSTPVEVTSPNLRKDEYNWWYTANPGQRLFPRKRLVVFGGDDVMSDGPSIYWHGLYPFAQLALNPVAWAPGGLSKFRDLLPLNRAINEIVASSLDVCRRAITPQVLSREGAIRPTEWRSFFPDMPGGKLRMTMQSNIMSDVRYMDPPILPAYVFAMLNQYLIPTFDRRSGRVDINRLTGKAQVPGGETIEQMRDAMQTTFRREARLIESFLMDVGPMVVSNIFQFWTGHHRVKLFGPDGQTMADFDYNPGTMVPSTVPREDHWKRFTVRVGPGSMHTASKDREKQIAMTLFRIGAISRDELLRRMEFTNAEQIISEIAAQQSSPELVPDATGKGRIPRLTRTSRTGGPF
jgi:hypothetical protein